VVQGRIKDASNIQSRDADRKNSFVHLQKVSWNCCGVDFCSRGCHKTVLFLK
jgi:hypothetical protein